MKPDEEVSRCRGALADLAGGIDALLKGPRAGDVQELLSHHRVSPAVRMTTNGKAGPTIERKNYLPILEQVEAMLAGLADRVGETVPDHRTRGRKVKIDDIVIGKRHRKNLGNLDGLMKSLEEVGLLHPIVVTTDNRLVAGMRRLKAAERLGWEDVDVRVIDADLILRGEHDENELREDFTISERVAIAREIQDRIGNRQGQRTDLKNKTNGELSSNCNEVVTGRTADSAAKQAGFDSKEALRRAATVVDKGTPELVQAVDAGDVSVSAAATVADLPKNEQKKAVKDGTVAETAKAQRAKKAKPAEPDKPTADEPETTAEAADPCEVFVGNVNRVCRGLDSIKKDVATLAAERPYGVHLHLDSITYQIETARKTLWQSRPTEPCNCVRGGEPNAKCKACFGTGKCPASRVLKGGR